MAKTDKPAKAAGKKTAAPAATKNTKKESTRGPIARRVDPNESANMAKVLKAVEKAGPAGVLQSSLKEAHNLHYPGWFYLQKLQDEGKVNLTTHNMRVYGTLKGTKFAPPAGKVAAPRAAKADKPAASAKAGATKNGVDKGARKAGAVATSKPANGTGKPAKGTGKAKGAKGTSKPAAPAAGSAAEQAANDLL